MYQDKPEWVAEQRKRWMRPDAERWMRPDADRYQKPPPFDHKAFIAEYRAQQARKAAGTTASADAGNPLHDPEVRRLLAEIKLDLVVWQLRRKYRPDQPRVPAGNPDGGQWTSEGGGAQFVRISNRTADADAFIHPADVQLDERPPRVEVEEVDALQLLDRMTHIQNSSVGIGVVGFVSGGRTDLPNGFLVTAGIFGVVARNPSTNNIEGRLYSVPGHITATIVSTPQGHVRVMYSRNMDI